MASKEPTPPEPVPAKVTDSGKMHMPIEVLRHLGISPGQQVVFVLKPGGHQALVVPFAEALRLDLPAGWH